jgi:hypothetical protein
MDQLAATGVLRNLLAHYTRVERLVLELAAESFAESGSDALVVAQREFTALVAFMECLGQALYLDMAAARRIGGPTIMRTELASAIGF